jgi:hypothetical protein
MDRKGQEVLYIQLLKALYGCMKSAMLWYDLFTDSLRKIGFVLNTYDQCIANCTLKGKQCTVAWYVDDNKISHEDPEMVSKVIREIEANFGKKGTLSWAWIFLSK